MQEKSKLKEIAKTAPNEPGVYLFKDVKGSVIYVGKAKNLRNRLNSYFASQLLYKTAQMMANADGLSYIKVESEFEALLLEANLIKKYKPKYNIALKDDKSPLYVAITKEEFPRIILFRKNEVKQYEAGISEFYGPYLSGFVARGILRRIRQIYPYSTHEPQKKICIYKQLGLCDPCPSEIRIVKNIAEKGVLRKKYLRNVRGVKNILRGKLGEVGKNLEREIKDYAKHEKFEEAQKVALQLKFFQRLTFRPDFEIDEYETNPNFIEDIRRKELVSLSRSLNTYIQNTGALHRIECFDIAHMSGSFPTASMVCFIDGEADKRYYRHFKIHQRKGNSDVDSMREVISRRLKHTEWEKPDLIIVDGGKPQLSKIHDLLEEANIPFIALAKRFETIVIYRDGEFVEIRAKGDILRLLQRIRDEAHRFARRLHHKQVKKNLI